MIVGDALWIQENIQVWMQKYYTLSYLGVAEPFFNSHIIHLYKMISNNGMVLF